MFFIKQNHLRKKLLVISSLTVFDNFWMKHLTKNVLFSVFASNSDSEFIFYFLDDNLFLFWEFLQFSILNKKQFLKPYI